MRWDRRLEKTSLHAASNGNDRAIGPGSRRWDVQHPGERRETVIVLKSRTQGTGKTTLSKVMREIFGAHAREISSKERLLGRFNADLETACWISAEEMLWAGDKGGADALKSIITGDTLTLEVKGGARWEVPNRLHIFMTTNHEHAIAAGVHERRHFVLEPSDEKARDRQWFDPLYADLEDGGKEQFLWLLLSLRLGKWHPRQLPKTAEIVDQQRMSADPVSQWASACIEADAILAPPSGMSRDLGQTINTDDLRSSYAAYCRQHGLRCVDERSFGRTLTAMFGSNARKRLPAPKIGVRRPYGYAVPDGDTWRKALDKYLGV
jgi:phage/plasmid-associated DNA primase